ncbi:MAG: hypothetical protein ABW020_13115 [Candidatus Rokuibacteriota bacterium]
MIFKWALAFFVLTSLVLFVLTKVIAFLNPPRPGRPEPRLLVKTRRALRWSLWAPALLGLAILVLTLWRA